MARCALHSSHPRPRELPGAARAAGTPHRHTATLSHCERGWLILTARLLRPPLVVAAGQRNTRPDSPSLCGIKFASYSEHLYVLCFTVDANLSCRIR